MRRLQRGPHNPYVQAPHRLLPHPGRSLPPTFAAPFAPPAQRHRLRHPRRARPRRRPDSPPPPQVTFTALQDLSTSPSSSLNNGLQVTSITDAAATTAPTTKSTSRNAPAAPPGTPHPAASSSSATSPTPPSASPPPNILARGTIATWTFTYSGVPTADTSPVDGIKLAARSPTPSPSCSTPAAGSPCPCPASSQTVSPPKCTSRVPAGRARRRLRRRHASTSSSVGKQPHGIRLQLDQTRLPRHHRRRQSSSRPSPSPGVPNFRAFVHRGRQGKSKSPRVQHHSRLLSSCPPPSASRRVRPDSKSSNYPEDAVSASWAPEHRRHRRKSHRRRQLRPPPRQHRRPPVVGFRSLPRHPQRRLDHQRHVPLRRTPLPRRHRRQNLFPDRRHRDVQAGALAYDTEPLTTMARLDPFSPQFQSMTLEKGAMVFHMLRLGDGRRHLLRLPQRRPSPNTPINPSAPKTSAPSPRPSPNSTSPASSRNGSTAPAHPSSPTSSPSSASARARASAPSAPSPRTSTSSPCL